MGGNFARGFGRGFNPNAMTASFMNQLRNKQITERQDKERQFILDKEQAKIDAQNKIDQQDANISNQIRSGVENVNLPQVGNRTQQLFGIPNIPKQVGVPLNQQPDGEIAGKRRLFGGLSTQGQTRFNREQAFANSLLPPEPEAPRKTYIETEKIGDKFRDVYGFPDGEGGYSGITKTAPHNIYTKKKDGSDKDYLDVSDGTKAVLKDYFKRQQDLRGITEAGFGANDYVGRNGVSTGETYSTAFEQHNKIYREVVRGIMTDEAKAWHDKLLNEFHFGDNPDQALIFSESVMPLQDAHPEDYLGKLKYDYVNGNIDLKDFNMLIEQFKPIYGYDARDRYGKNLERIE